MRFAVLAGDPQRLVSFAQYHRYCRSCPLILLRQLIGRQISVLAEDNGPVLEFELTGTRMALAGAMSGPSDRVGSGGVLFPLSAGRAEVTPPKETLLKRGLADARLIILDSQLRRASRPFDFDELDPSKRSPARAIAGSVSGKRATSHLCLIQGGFTLAAR